MAKVTPSATPNPNAMKFTLDAPLAEMVNVTRREDATHAFTVELFALDGVVAVFGTADFVTVSKAPEASWDQLSPAVSAILARTL